MDKDKMIYDLLKELRDDQKELVSKSTEHREDSIKWQAEASGRLENIEVDLRDHKEGVIQNRAASVASNARISVLEEPGKAAKYLSKKWKFWTVAIVLTTATITLISKIKGLW